MIGYTSQKISSMPILTLHVHSFIKSMIKKRYLFILSKFIAFVDRALGITTYDGSMLINIDRLAMDDYKGVGEGYSFVRQNKFNFKFAITSKSDDLERVWQRSYDDSLIGFFTPK